MYFLIVDNEKKCLYNAWNIQPIAENSAQAKGIVWLVGNCTKGIELPLTLNVIYDKCMGVTQLLFFLSATGIGNIPHRRFLLIERATAVCSLSSQFDDRATRTEEKRTVSFCMKCYCRLCRPLCFAPFRRVRMQQVRIFTVGNVKLLFVAVCQMVSLSRTFTNI